MMVGMVISPPLTPVDGTVRLVKTISGKKPALSAAIKPKINKDVAIIIMYCFFQSSKILSEDPEFLESFVCLGFSEVFRGL